MPNTDIHPPFEAYKGNDPYIFVSYAHKDSATVFPELQELRLNGYRVWYDEGIDPGNEWPEEVAMALSRAAMFLVFVSSNAVASQNVRNEINFAINNRKPFLAVYLIETELPVGLQLRMGDIQAIMKHRMSIESYRRKLGKALPATLRMSREDIDIEEIASGLRQVMATGEMWALGGVDVCLSADKATFIGSLTGDLYPGNIRDLKGHGWQVEKPTSECKKIWPTDSTAKSLKGIALDIIYASKLEGYNISAQKSQSSINTVKQHDNSHLRKDSSSSNHQPICFNERAKHNGNIQVYHVASLDRWPYETVESCGIHKLTSPIELNTNIESGTKYRCVSSRPCQSIEWGLLTHNIKGGKDKYGNVLPSSKVKLPTDLWIQIDFRLFHSVKRSDDELISKFRDHVMAEECENPRPNGEIQPTQVKIGSDNDPYFQWFEMGEAQRSETTYVFVSTTSHLEYINAHTIPAGIDFGFVVASVIHFKKYRRVPTYAELFDQFERLNGWFAECGGCVTRL